MSRKHLTFECSGETLFGSIDQGNSTAGLLIVSGGNEIRSGAFSSQAAMAAEISARGFPVFRFDRRGIGDSSGENGGFKDSSEDILSAIAAFRQSAPLLQTIVGFGNCDAASALMMHSARHFDALALSNPWTFEEEDGADALPPEAIRARYAQRMKNPREVFRLLSGGVNLRKLASGLLSSLQPNAPASSLASQMQQGLDGYAGPVRILLAGRDRTAQAFAANWPDDDRIVHRTGADHSFSSAQDSHWLLDQVLAMLHEQAG